MPGSVSAADLLGLIAEPERLRVVAALALGATGTAQIADRAGLPLRDAVRVLSRLESGGLVSGQDGGWLLHIEMFKAAARASAPPAASPADFGSADPGTAAVLRAFLRDGRLTSVPTARSKRLVVLDHVARVFEPGRRYPEKEVSAVLRAFHPDYAALRRYLVDEGFLSREAGVYWRSGGTVEI